MAAPGCLYGYAPGWIVLGRRPGSCTLIHAGLSRAALLFGEGFELSVPIGQTVGLPLPKMPERAILIKITCTGRRYRHVQIVRRRRASEPFRLAAQFSEGCSGDRDRCCGSESVRSASCRVGRREGAAR